MYSRFFCGTVSLFRVYFRKQPCGDAKTVGKGQFVAQLHLIGVKTYIGMKGFQLLLIERRCKLCFQFFKIIFQIIQNGVAVDKAVGIGEGSVPQRGDGFFS